MERRHFLKLAFGFAAGAAAFAASARASPIMPQPLAEDGRLPPSNEDARPAVTTGDEVNHLKPEECAGAVIGAGGVVTGAAVIGAGAVVTGAAATGAAVIGKVTGYPGTGCLDRKRPQLISLGWGRFFLARPFIHNENCQRTKTNSASGRDMIA